MPLTFKNVGSGITIRAPKLTDFDFVAGYIPSAVPLGGSASGQNTVFDCIYDITNGATVVNCPNASSFVTVGQSNSAKYVSLTPSIVTVNSLTGITTYISSGTAVVRIDYPSLSRTISFPVSSTTTSGSAFNSFVTGSLAQILNSGTMSRVSSGSSRLIYSNQDHANLNYTRNSSLWLSGVNISAISPYNSELGTRKGATAITNSHVLMANHYFVSNGYTVRFVDMNNNIYDRIVASSVRIGTTDIRIGFLSTPLPSSIVPVKLMPSGWMRYLGVQASSINMFGTPTYLFGNAGIIWVNQDNYLMLAQTKSVNNYEYPGSLTAGTNVAKETIMESQVPTTNIASGYGLTGTVRSGDSGRPVCAVVSGQLAILFTQYSSSAGPDLAYYTSQINTAIAPSSVSTVSLSALTQYSSGILATTN